MKIKLNEVDQTQFLMNPHIVNGETMWLVQPNHIGTKFNQANKHLRSSVWNDDGELVSAGFPKFVNWGENPENFPVPTSLKNTHIVEKIDGSLLIVSKYKGKYILRTRGTVDASKLDNGHELELFKRTILPNLGLDIYDTGPISILFEWVSPKQRIILNYGSSPDWYLVGVVSHSDYSLWEQDSLNEYAQQRVLKRPPVYSFPDVNTLMKDVEAWKGKEGVVVYSNDDQILHKTKSTWYLFLHRMKEALVSIDKIIDVWFEQGSPAYQEFEEFVVNQFDWELWSQIRSDASRICNAYKEVELIQVSMQKFVNESLRPMSTRKDQATKTIAVYGNQASFVFKLLDGRSLDTEDRKKLLYQVLKK